MFWRRDFFREQGATRAKGRMEPEARQIAIGAIFGAFFGVAAFFLVGLLRYSAGDDVILSIGWGLAALVAPIVLGRLLDGVLWVPALRARRPDEQPTSDAELPAEDAERAQDRGTSIDIAVDDDVEAVLATPNTEQDAAAPRAA